MIGFVIFLNISVLVIFIAILWWKAAELFGDVTRVIPDLRHVVNESDAVLKLLLVHLANLATAVDRGIAGVTRIEEDRATVAVSLVNAQTAVDQVAKDLQETHARADSVGPGHAPGTASDAAVRSNPNTEAT